MGMEKYYPRPKKKVIVGETFTLMQITDSKAKAKKWAEGARKHPHNARCRVIPTRYEFLVYCHGMRKRKRKK